ncbi:MAG: HEAT repeat domain-containing protein [Gemmatales bacterium]
MFFDLLVILSVMASYGVFENLPAVQQAEFQANLKILQSNKPDQAKIAALKRLELTKVKEATQSFPAIESLLKGQHSQDLRCQAAISLGVMAFQRKLTCPLALIDAMVDQDDEVASFAANYAGVFKRFPDNIVDILLKSAVSKQSIIRSHAIAILAHVGSKDKRVLDVLEHALNDSWSSVRNNSHVTLYALTNNFERYLKYILLVLIDRESVLGKVDPTKRDAKFEQEALELIELGSKFRLIEWSENKAEEYSSTLLKLMKSEQAELRQGAIFAVKNCFIKADLDYFLNFRNAEPDKTKERQPKAAKLLWDKNILDILKQIEKNDPDNRVRQRASIALDEIKTQQQK